MEKAVLDKIKAFHSATRNIAHEGWFQKNKETDLTEALLNLLANQHEKKYDSYSEELSALSRVVSKISESIEEDVLTEDEARILISHMFSAFISRRMDHIVDGLFARRSTNWFLAAKKHYYEREI